MMAHAGMGARRIGHQTEFGKLTTGAIHRINKRAYSTMCREGALVSSDVHQKLAATPVLPIAVRVEVRYWEEQEDKLHKEEERKLEFGKLGSCTSGLRWCISLHIADLSCLS